jgi:hypothetical protein
MKSSHDKRPKRVSEPVQVYLAIPDLKRLEWLTEQLGMTKSAVLRDALQALEHQIGNPAGHPALRVIGVASGDVAPDPYDVAREHDRYLADI